MNVTWHLPQRIILLKSAGEADTPDKIDHELTTLLQQGQAPVHLLIEGKVIEQRPSLMVFRRWQWSKQPALGKVMPFGVKDKSLQVVISLASRLSSVQVQFCRTLDESLAALKKVEPNLPITPGHTSILIDPSASITREVEQDLLWRAIYAQLVKVADGRCEFCRTPLPYALELIPTEIVPTMHERIVFENLCLTCAYCHKLRVHQEMAIDPLSTVQVSLFNPRRENWHEHFVWTSDFQQMAGLTAIGRATILHMRLHSKYYVNLRQVGLTEGWHPPRILTTAQLKQYYFPNGAKIRLEIHNPVTGEKEDILMLPSRPLLLGRHGATSPQRPDIDLEPYGGYRLGVSRIHARLNPPNNNLISISDMGSSNGTFVNNERVSVHESRRLSHADEIRLGKLVMLAYFVQ